MQTGLQFHTKFHLEFKPDLSPMIVASGNRAMLQLMLLKWLNYKPYKMKWKILNKLIYVIKCKLKI